MKFLLMGCSDSLRFMFLFFLSFYVDLIMSFGLRAVYTSHAVWQ
jgi:hypothetical protein